MRNKLGSLHALLQLFAVVFSKEIAIKNERCKVCHFLTETFEAGMRNTARDHFGGGDTAWEEKNLGKYATSETRLVEVQEGLCKKSTLSNTDGYLSIKELEFKCSALLEEHEELVEDYYYKNQQHNFSKWMCTEQLKLCCPLGHFGKNCDECSGLKQTGSACYGQGQCHGDGSREGSGKCNCNAGYIGHFCSNCDSDYFQVEKTDRKITCEKCHESCTGGCKSIGPLGCNKCRTGWSMDEKLGCVDVDECAIEPAVCTRENEKCVNSEGSYRCACVDGYKRNGADCTLDVEVKFAENNASSGTSESEENNNESASENTKDEL
ncbi:hypothetical protein WR25_14356 [Diploscapter pachys]|uniref:EGF-like domain-containing protein n=1 Tax=Diploscapter pachys TaxID=2018661 RepID=A0A2A2J2U4_9BILA|nr:hypothetical protein WR25_14356 [Diploscapter pachys]